VIELEVQTALEGERLDRVVALAAEVSRTVAATLIAEGFVELDGVVATTGKARLASGQHVAIDTGGITVAPPPMPDSSIRFEVVHVDHHVIVVDKPAGLVVHPAAGTAAGTLVNGLLADFPELAGVGPAERPGIVHRLDAGTSGLMVVARSEEALAVLTRRLAARDVERVYRALVWGHPSAAQGTIDAPIGRHPADPLRMAVVVSGRPARTHFEVLRTFPEPLTAELRCRLETGRTHQIRVHLAAIGHPVVGDRNYGGLRAASSLERPFLHAEHLAFAHPITGEHLEFHSELPAELLAALPPEGQSAS
jgi:23S rRNA pseudouridine1911/1915/1917 synthase